MQVWPHGRENPLEKAMATHSSILAWEIHGQKSLMGYSPWSCKQSDTNEHTHTHTQQSSHSLADEIIQPIKTNHAVFQGLFPSETAYTLWKVFLSK